MPNKEPEDMGFRAEGACADLATAIFPHYFDTYKRRRVTEALRRFMSEAKKSIREDQNND